MWREYGNRFFMAQKAGVADSIDNPLPSFGKLRKQVEVRGQIIIVQRLEVFIVDRGGARRCDSIGRLTGLLARAGHDGGWIIFRDLCGSLRANRLPGLSRCRPRRNRGCMTPMREQHRGGDDQKSK
jgi:hypothetical protein